MAATLDTENKTEATPSVAWWPSDLRKISDEYVRSGFVRKVYGIVASQVALTALISAVCMTGPVSKALLRFVGEYPQLISWGTTSAPALALAALTYYKKKSPLNMCFLAIFTLVTAFSLGIVCAYMSAAGMGFVILQAAVLTAALFAGLTIYAFKSKQDFSFLGATLFPCLFALCAYGMLALIFPSMRMDLPGLAFSLAGAVLFCFYIVYDTFRVLHELGPDDYVEVAIQLYLDIVNLFLYIQEFLAKMTKDDQKSREKAKEE